MIVHSAIIDHKQKLIVKDSLIMYVCQLQKQYFRDGAIPFNEYEKKMKSTTNTTSITNGAQENGTKLVDQSTSTK